jgi:hypothetical protein
MYKKTITITAITFLILLISLILAGCGDGLAPESKESTVQPRKAKVDESEVEATLIREVADGKLVEVYDEFVRIKPGGIEKNWIIINNVKDTAEEFHITPCAGCDFDVRAVEVPAGEHKIVQFKVRALEGQTEIKVRDKLNNAYGYAKISIIVDWS